ncbi:MAG: phosphopantetheine-binding protein [Betaproteobacteria bacterium]|nr:phosphopantetheine-binding protein [Betaproteobacteria bacterium]
MLERVIEFIRDHKGLNDIEITGECQLVRDLGLTSFDLVTMMCRIEEEFGIIVDDAMMLKSITVSDVARALAKSQSSDDGSDNTCAGGW